MSGYEITFSITVMCPCCGKELPSSHYLTESRPCDGPLSRDNPYERKDRRVFITPCPECFVHQSKADGDQLEKSMAERDELLEALRALLTDVGRANSMLSAVKARAAIAKATGSAS